MTELWILVQCRDASDRTQLAARFRAEGRKTEETTMTMQKPPDADADVPLTTNDIDLDAKSASRPLTECSLKASS